ncbi:hypothetical protein XANCAGTX0491_002516 [Xanthoria calcicola]
MASHKTIIHFVILPILTILAIIAGVSLGQIRYLSLPSPASPIATLLLPILTALTIQSSRSLLLSNNNNNNTNNPPSKHTRSLPRWLFPTLLLALTIYDTVLATLASTQLIPSDAQTCTLLTRWEHFFTTHDVDRIRRIQDTHRCCGFKTLRHMPWPFPDNNGADACRDQYHRTRTCFGGWRGDLQLNAGAMLGVAVGCFLVKLFIVLALYRRRNDPRMQRVRRQYAGLTESDDEVEDHRNGHGGGRGAVQGRIEAPYRDEVATDAETETQGRDRNGPGPRAGGMVVQPSSMQGGGSEWRS